MNSITPVITIKSKKIEAISQYLCDNEEILYASKVQFNYPPSRHLPAQIGYAILTYGFIYLFTKENKELKFQEQIHVFNCQDIKFMNNKGKDGKAALLIKVDSEQNIFTILNGEKMDIFYEYLVYSISIISNGRSSHFTSPKLNPQIPLKIFAVQFRILKRSLYLIHLDMKSEKIPKSSLEGSNYFKNPSIYFKNQLLINSDFHPSNFSDYYGRAIGIEPNIMVVVFQNFSEEFTNLFKSILINSIRIIQIKFDNYTTAPNISFEKVEKTTVNKFQFTNSSFKILENFIEGCSKCTYNIKNIKINSVEVHQNDLISIFENLNKLNCFKNLTYFSLINTKFEFFKSFPLEAFNEFIKLHTKLISLTISDIDVDGTFLLEEICKVNSSISELHLNHLNFDTPLNLNDDQNPLNLPHNIVLLDLSHSTFKNVSMASLLQLITKDNGDESSNLIVNMNHLEPKENTFIKAFKSVDLQKCKSNIFYFNWSGNNLSPEFFNFIEKQKKNLKFLSLLDLNVEKQNGFFQALMKFLLNSDLFGIEIGCNSFDPELVNQFLDFLKVQQSLQNFHFCCQPKQNKIGEKLAELISSLSNLKGLRIEANGMSSDVYFKIASAVVNNKSISSCVFSGWEVDKNDPKIAEIVPMLAELRKMKAPMPMEQIALSKITNKKNPSSDVTANLQEQSKSSAAEEEEV